MGEGEYEKDDYEPPVPKRKRISNAETVQMMMMAEAERASVNNQFLDVLKGFQSQGDAKMKLMEKIFMAKQCSASKSATFKNNK